MRCKGRVDANQPLIVRELRHLGASVAILSDLGGGIADILVGYRGSNFAFEIKDGSLSPSRRRLTDDEK